MSATAARAGRRSATRPSRVQRGEETRAALLRSASRTICEFGMHGASIDRIAADAGYTKGAFYAHFASKEDLFLRMLDEHFATELARLATHAARNEAFRIEFAARQRDLRERMAAVFTRWAADFGVIPPVPPEDVAAMTFFMADGFLLDQLIDPELDAALYGKMFEVFMHGLMSMTDPSR